MPRALSSRQTYPPSLRWFFNEYGYDDAARAAEVEHWREGLRKS